MSTERIEGPTPAGGEWMEVSYLNDAGEPANKIVATQAEIVEFDAGGEEINRLYVNIKNAS
jgi:hypothetical protein